MRRDTGIVGGDRGLLGVLAAGFLSQFAALAAILPGDDSASGRAEAAAIGLSAAAISLIVAAIIALMLLDRRRKRVATIGRSAPVKAVGRSAPADDRDPLTGLPNHTVHDAQLARALARAAKTSRTVALLRVGLDGLQATDARQGRSVADSLLVDAANRLCSAAGDQDIVTRLVSGDFAIIQFGGDQPRRAGVLGDRIVRALTAPPLAGNRDAEIGTSVGIAMYPLDARDAQTLMRHADAALRDAGVDGVGQVRFHPTAV
jgi:diguanylate cyclase (GGDEF)-like protein